MPITAPYLTYNADRKTYTIFYPTGTVMFTTRDPAQAISHLKNASSHPRPLDEKR